MYNERKKKREIKGNKNWTSMNSAEYSTTINMDVLPKTETKLTLNDHLNAGND